MTFCTFFKYAMNTASGKTMGIGGRPCSFFAASFKENGNALEVPVPWQVNR